MGIIFCAYLKFYKHKHPESKLLRLTITSLSFSSNTVELIEEEVTKQPIASVATPGAPHELSLIKGETEFNQRRVSHSFVYVNLFVPLLVGGSDH